MEIRHILQQLYGQGKKCIGGGLAPQQVCFMDITHFITVNIYCTACLLLLILIYIIVVVFLFILCSVSFIVVQFCVLCFVWSWCYFLWCVLFVCYVLLSYHCHRVKNPFAVQINNNNNNNTLYCGSTPESRSGSQLDGASLSNGSSPRFWYTRYSLKLWRPIFMTTF
jgi:hypothetical protein